MASRTLPPPDPYAIGPHEGVVLDFFAGTFQSVQVLLHPFIKPISIPVSRFSPGTYPDRQEIADTCQPISWAQIQHLAGFDSLASLDVALRTQIRGLKAEFCNEELARSLQESLDREGVIAPNAGEFSDLTHNEVLSFIQSQGYTWVWVGDEFCTERKLYWIDDLKAPNSHVTSGHKSVFTPDKKILWTNHWDSHFAFFCATDAIVEAIASEKMLEGFRCGPRTEVYWSVRG